MKRIGMSDPNYLSYRDGGGCVTLFGLPFLIAGLAVLFLSFSGTLKGKNGQPAPLIFGILFGGVFTLVGSILSLGRSGYDFDRRLKTVREWSGLLFPMFTRLHAINSYNEVRISREVRKSKNSTYYVYEVSLRHNGENALKLTAPTDMHEARRLGEEIAKFVELPLVDACADEVVRRPHDQLDASLKEQIERSGKSVDLSAPPEGMRTTYEAHGDAVHFHIPPPPASCMHFAPVGCATIFAGIFASTMFADILTGATSSTEKLVFASVVGFFFIVLPIGGTFLGALSQRRKRWEVVANPQELRVTTYGLLGGRESMIPASKLEELRLESTKGGESSIAAISDEVRINFGEGLKQPEAQWIIQVIKRAVTA